MKTDKYSPNSYFFTDPAALSQTAEQVFGPVSDDEYRVTTKFSFTANTMAYAICKSIVLIQPQTGNSSKVNLILRPFSQPIQGINIKYFIYRGLNKADFFNTDQVIAATGTTSAFINKITSQFNEFYANNSSQGPAPDFLAKYIGYDPSVQADTLLLDQFFFKETAYVESNGEFIEDEETAYELPVIEAGASLGNFSSGECGIDIVLNYGDYKEPVNSAAFTFNLAYARATEAKINIAAITDAFIKKQVKEQIFQFLDAAAYFGFHASTEKGQVKLNHTTTIQIKKGEQVYTDVIQNFYTKNNFYLYIQSERTRSYNFYNNYFIEGSTVNSLKIGETENTLTEAAYEKDGWPILILDEAQDHNETTNTHYLQLVTDNNPNTMLYGQVAQIENAQANNFIDADNLKQALDTEGNESIFTNTINLSNPASGIAGTKYTIATFNILLYQGKTYSYLAGQIINEDNEEEDVYAAPNFFDDVFGELQAIALLQNATNNTYSSITFQKLKLINHYYDKKQQGISAVQTTRVKDEIATQANEPNLERVTYITEAIDVLSNVTSVSGSLTARTKSSPSASGAVDGNTTYKLPEPFYYTLQTFTDSTEQINGLLLKTMDDSIPGKLILGLTKAENDELLGLITTNTPINARLFMVDLFKDGNQLISSENILYQKYKAGIVGEKADGTLELFMPETDIMVYSLDRNYHFTMGYSEYMKYEPVLTSLILDLNLSL
jgi:hypothetical protein